MSSGYARVNVSDVENVAPKYGMQFGEARFPNDDLGNEDIGLSHYRIGAGKRLGFGHRHKEAQELYVVLEGTGRAKLDDEIIDLATLDVIRVAPPVLREFEGGPDGMTLLATGQRIKGDAEMVQEFWTD